jgi:transposase-like protein
MIRKLYIALQSLALQYFKSVEEIKSEKKLEQARTNTDETSSSSTLSSGDSPNVRLDKLQEQKNELLIEESFLLLLKDTGSTKSNYIPTIDYQKNTIRSSSGFEDAISSSLYTILSSKVFFLNKEIEKLERERDSSTTQNKKAESLKSKVGARLAKDLSPISVGAIDIIVYALAFLTVEESTLIGLLNERQIKQLDIDTENKYKFSDDFKNQSNDMSLSINKLTVRVFNLYKIFIDFKNNKDFSVPQSKAV